MPSLIRNIPSYTCDIYYVIFLLNIFLYKFTDSILLLDSIAFLFVFYQLSFFMGIISLFEKDDIGVYYLIYYVLLGMNFPILIMKYLYGTVQNDYILLSETIGIIDTDNSWQIFLYFILIWGAANSFTKARTVYYRKGSRPNNITTFFGFIFLPLTVTDYSEITKAMIDKKHDKKKNVIVERLSGE